jgi:Leucine-rich repeat (LRR) protein
VAGGARLPSGASLRFHGYCRLRASIPSLSILAIFLAMLLSAGCGQQTDFESQGLPGDLPHYLGQLRSLKVPASVTRLDWLPATLEELDASQTAVSTLPYVPPGLQRLDLSFAKNLACLPRLPSSLKELDVRYTQLQGPWTNSQHLESLHLGGDQVKTLEGLSESLFEVTIDDARIQSTAGLPRFLQSLSISGAASSESGEPLLKNLGKLPPRLKELHLTNTGIEALKALPATLQSLTLINNVAMEVELPRFLVSLTLGGDHQRMSSLEDLQFLNQLELQRATSLKVLPPFLRDLRVAAPGRWSQQLTPSLKSLWVMSDTAVNPPALPRGLEDLRWRGASNVKGLPPGLQRLDIGSSPLTDLADLPPKVTSLDVSSTIVPIDKLPARLQSLQFRFCPFREVSGLPRSLRRLDLSGSAHLTTLDLRSLSLERLDISQTAISEVPVLPPTLQELDISNTPIAKLQNLPAGLRSLTVHKGQLHSLAGLPHSVTKLYFLERK